MSINELINQSEGRRLEFKGELPTNSDLAKTVVAFANDAGGEIYIGINDNPRQIIGLSEEELPRIEEQISNLIYDRCYPIILPEVSFLTIEDKHLIKVCIYRGSMPPYYLKDKGKLKGTYIRVGSTNKLADETIIAELERRRRNISFDSEVVMDKSADELDISGFKLLYKEKTGEDLNIQVLRKLELVKTEQDKEYPTKALLLFSDDNLRNSMFPNAKVECARFKGTGTEEFLDQKSIIVHIGLQAAETYNFVLREIIRNAIVHRDYSLTGKDVKVAIYDDMVEITSPGLLPPSIDYSAMESRQSDARNKVIAPVFKRLGIIDQWGNGLKMVAEEMKSYPEIDLCWKEVGLSFQVQFIKKNYQENINMEDSADNERRPAQYTTQHTTQSTTQYTTQKLTEAQNMILSYLREHPEATRADLNSHIEGITVDGIKYNLARLQELGLLKRVGSKRYGYWVVLGE